MGCMVFEYTVWLIILAVPEFGIIQRVLNWRCHKLAQFGPLHINGSCHEWQLPLVIPAIDAPIFFGLVQFWHNRPKPLILPKLPPTAKITRYTVLYLEH